ncbi:GFA family protein [Pelagibacterium limicola]|uniref:GFA family protein n=1 Tax=Pelagibacterium limicola TaxID=2791022 RepID=UPI0018AF5BA8|nr:GFA family protein [Pelagibacterium limicola]
MNKITYTGGCACGAIRYGASTEPVSQNHCQCLDCQKRSGTGHGSYLSFMQPAADLVTGQSSQWTVTADSGNDKTHHFCPICGTPVYLTFAAMPDLTAIHATSLDDPRMFEPQAVTYAFRGHPWDVLDGAIPKFEKMPSA